MWYGGLTELQRDLVKSISLGNVPLTKVIMSLTNECVLTEGSLLACIIKSSMLKGRTELLNLLVDYGVSKEYIIEQAKSEINFNRILKIHTDEQIQYLENIEGVLS